MSDPDQVSNLLNPPRGVRDVMRRQGVKPRNHHRDNIAALREQSTINNLKKQLEEKQAEVQQLQNRSKVVKVVRSPVKGKADSAVDFVRKNALAAKRQPKVVRPAKPEAPKYRDKTSFGAVPEYLQDRKAELAAECEAKLLAARELEVPSGMPILPEEERQATLEILRVNRAEVESKLHTMPFLVETPSQVTYKASLENRLREIDEAERLFSRTTVVSSAWGTAGRAAGGRPVLTRRRAQYVKA